MEEKVGEQELVFDAKELLEPITKAVRDTSEKSLRKSKPTTKTIEETMEPNIHVKLSKIKIKFT